MKKVFISFAAFLVSMAFGLSGQAFAGDILFINASASDLHGLYLTQKPQTPLQTATSPTHTDETASPSGVEELENLLSTPLPVHAGVVISFPPNTSPAWNIIAVHADGSSTDFENIPLQDIVQVHIRDNGSLDIYR